VKLTFTVMEVYNVPWKTTVENHYKQLAARISTFLFNIYPMFVLFKKKIYLAWLVYKS